MTRLTKEPLKNVGEAGKTRQKQPKKRSLRGVNEHFEAVFNAVLPTQVVFQRFPGKDSRAINRVTAFRSACPFPSSQ